MELDGGESDCFSFGKKKRGISGSNLPRIEGELLGSLGSPVGSIRFMLMDICHRRDMGGNSCLWLMTPEEGDEAIRKLECGSSDN